jgi:hypothetical protein
MAVAFTIKRGDPWRQEFSWREESETGPVIDLTGVTAFLQLRDRSKALVLDCTPYLSVDGPTGTVTVAVPKEQTRSLPVGKLQFDIELSVDAPSTETMTLKVVEDETVL